MLLKALKARAFLIAYVVSTLAAHCASFQVSNHLNSPTTEVTVDKAVPLKAGMGSDGHYKMMDVSISYKFSGRETVWLEGVGTLPGSGTIAYVIRKDTVIFRDTKDGTVLATVPIAPTVIPLSGPHVGDPYPPSNDEHWHQDGPSIDLPIDPDTISQTLYNTLGKQPGAIFISYSPCHLYDDNCAESMWSSITPSSANVQMEVAVMLVYNPKRGDAGKSQAELFYIGRKGYRGSPTWDYSLDADSLQTVAGKVADLRSKVASLH